MVSTSFWSGFESNLFASNKYPNVDYADIHQYIPRDTDLAHFQDTALSTYDLGLAYGALQSGSGKPIIRGETGLINEKTNAGFTIADVSADTQGIWLHNLIWGGINPTGLIENYWYANAHIYKTVDLRYHFKNYYLFIKDIPLNNGKYTDAAAVVSDPKLRAWGQKDVANQRAHLWIANTDHVWTNSGSAQPVSGTVTIAGLSANTSFQVEWWDPYTGTVKNSEMLSTSSTGEIVLTISNLSTDIAVKLVGQGTSTPPTNTPVVTNTPITTPTNTATNTPANTATVVATNTPVYTATYTPTNPAPTNTPAPTATNTLTVSSTPTATAIGPLPGQPRILTAQALNTRSGTTNGSLAALGTLDQKDKEDDPSKYVTFQTPRQRYTGTLSYSLPADIPAGTVSELVLQINLKGTPSKGQTWTWGIYDWTNKRWIKAGGVTTGSNIRWQALEFRLPFRGEYLSATREIQIQLRSNNDLGDAKIDYQVLQVVSGSNQTSAAGMVASRAEASPTPTLEAVTTNVEPTATSTVEMPPSPTPELVEPAATETPLVEPTPTVSP
jgi:hypothetical protein